MSFFSRLSNLVSGFSNNMLNRLEEGNPQLKKAQRKQEMNKLNHELQEAASNLLVLEKELEGELEEASLERQQEIQKKLSEYRDQRKEMNDLIRENQNRSHSSELQEITNRLDQETAAEESLQRLRARTDSLEKIVTPPSLKKSTPPSPTKEPPDTENKDSIPSKKRTL